jgi:hypothetical protein
MFSLRYDFPQAWTHVRNSAGAVTVEIDLSPDRFPYLFATREISLGRAETVAGAFKEAHNLDTAAGTVQLPLSAAMCELICGAS